MCHILGNMYLVKRLVSLHCSFPLVMRGFQSKGRSGTGTGRILSCLGSGLRKTRVSRIRCASPKAQPRVGRAYLPAPSQLWERSMLSKDDSFFGALVFPAFILSLPFIES